MSRLSVIFAVSTAAAVLVAPATAQAADKRSAAGSGPEPDIQQVSLTVPARIPVEYLVGSDLRIPVTPATYSGRISVRSDEGQVLASAVASGGRVRLHVAAPDLGTIPVKITAEAIPGFDAASERSKVVSRGVRLERGDRHPVVAELLRALRKQHYLIPRVTTRYGKAVSDVVLAFQKVNRLPRTAEMNARTWRAFAAAEPVTPRRRGRGVHLEVDKTRQVLMLVKNGKVKGTLHVSTGATGNTPEGRFRIYAKGVGSLFRFMPFTGNFGIHGYIPVPPYPASHGCVREPMWAADWTYRRTRVGTPIFIFH